MKPSGQLRLTVILLIATVTNASTDRKWWEPEAWKTETSFGFAVSVASNFVIDAPALSHRNIYVFLQPHDFTLDNVKLIFSVLAARYPDPKELWIDVYSDKAAVRRAVRTRKSGVSVDFPSTPEGRRAGRNHELLTEPSVAGMFLARYLRWSGDRETLWFKPSRDEDHELRIDLRHPEIPYSGDPTSDLQVAIDNDDVQKALQSLDAGADCQNTDRWGNTVLMKAAGRGQVAVVRSLLSKGARLDAESKGYSESGRGFTALTYAAADGSVQVVTELINAGADVNSHAAGEIPLTLAALQGHEAVVRVLLESGAHVDATNEYGETALMCAAMASYPDIVRLLVRKGADVNARDHDGRTALMLVCDNSERRETDTLSALLQARADFRAKDKQGRTALMFAASHYMDDAVKILVKHDVKRTAIAPCTAAIAQYSRDEDAYRILREVYLALRRYKDAIEISEKSVAALPDLGQPYYNLGTAYLAAGDTKKAREVHEWLLRKSKESTDEQSARMFQGWADGLKEMIEKPSMK